MAEECDTRCSFVPEKRKKGMKADHKAISSPATLRDFARGACAGQAKLVKAGSDIVFQMHYTANGKAGIGPEQSRRGVRDGAPKSGYLL